MRTQAPPIIGREEEAARLREFLAAPEAGPAALVLMGEPGIGKTTVWQQAELWAADEGWTVLSARPAEAERDLAFSVLGDLLRNHHDHFGVLPPPQRRALEAALLGAVKPHVPPSPRAMGLGLLRLIQELVADRPLLLAVDDAQWIDGSSAIVLSFAMRRLGTLQVRVLITTRLDSWELATRHFGLDHWPSGRVETLAIGGLSLPVLGRLIEEALGINLPRPVLRRLGELAHGNPYHALQVAPLLAEAPAAEAWSLPVPDTPAEAILARLGRLPASMRKSLAVFSAASPQTLQAIRDGGPVVLRRALDAAIRQGVLQIRSGRPQFSHPLIPSVVYGSLSADERQRTHRRLAEVAVDPSERARHRALASAGPDESAATDLVGAARREEARGAPEAAGALLELAAKVSPDTEDRYRRLIAAADAFDLAGLLDRAADVLRVVITSPLAGGQRHRARISLATRAKDFSEIDRQLTAILREPTLEPDVRAEAYSVRAGIRFNSGDLQGAIDDSKAALTSAEEADDATAAVSAAVNLAWLETFAAPARPEPLERAGELSGGADYLGYGANPDLVVALRHLYRDRVDEARAGLDGLIALATQRGDDASLAGYHFHATEVEVRAASFAAAEEHAHQALEIDRAIGHHQGMAVSAFAAALTAAHLGQIDVARRFAVEGLVTAESLGDWIFRLQNATALGFIDLSTGASEAAADRLGGIPRELLAHGFREPSVIPAWPNAIEALLQAGRVREAEDLVPTYLELAGEFDCPWARATGKRCEGLLAAARGDLPTAEATLREAADTHADLVSPFERARTLLALGSVLRRQRLRREARDVIGEAQQTFASLGATGWAERARQEAARIRGRQSDLPGLSVTELSVARIVADGHTNREVAAVLFMAERTVEANLTSIYAKLGIRSRTELTRWMDKRPESAAPLRDVDSHDSRRA
jgi:DNA-binding CsgD family transcriptional regulator